MLEIKLTDAGKRFNREWIFRGWNAGFKSGESWVILGNNGSGKSTALRTLLGYSPLSEGSLIYTLDGKPLPREKAYRHFSICGPYLELYEELTLDELLRFHFSLKPALPDIQPGDVPELIQLSSARPKPVKNFSSGMKQRLRLGLALLSDVKVVLLDEPVSNLDRNGVNWYSNLVNTYRRDRLIVVASNRQQEEFAFCENRVDMEGLKG